MIKKIILKLKSIKYSGDSIGDDTRLEISILGKSFNIKKNIKVGTKQEFSKIVGEFDTDRKIFETDIDIRVIEEDLIFNDIGNLKTQIKIDTAKDSQELTYEVLVKEFRINVSKTKAVFVITLQVEILSIENFVSETSDGWLKVDINGVKKKESLPAFLRVKLLQPDNKKDYFTILEGLHRGKNASVSRKSDNTSYLQSGILVREPALVTYSISTKVLTINNKKYKTTDFEPEKWETGVYDIEIPDAPHKGGIYYTNKAKFAKVWFRVGHSQAKYLHTGRHSLGCITVLEQEHWDEIFYQLIKARKGDGVSVGVLTIVE